MRISSKTAYFMLLTAFITVFSQCCAAMNSTGSVSIIPAEAMAIVASSDTDSLRHSHHAEIDSQNQAASISHHQMPDNHACCDPANSANGLQSDAQLMSHLCDGCEPESIFPNQIDLLKAVTFDSFIKHEVFVSETCNASFPIDFAPPNRGSPLFIQFCSYLI